MRVALLFTLLAYACTQVLATKVIFEAIIFTIPVWSGTLITDDGHIHSIGAGDGCRTGGLPFVKQFCYDEKRDRAHIVWTNQPNRKYCFKKTSSTTPPCTRFAGESCWRGLCPTCWRWEYSETPCTW